MAKVTRRTFLTRTTASAAVLGVAAGALGGGFGVEAADTLAHGAPAAASHTATSTPLVVYVRDAATGEVTFLHGTREVTRRDHALVARLLRTAL